MIKLSPDETYVATSDETIQDETFRCKGSIIGRFIFTDWILLTIPKDTVNVVVRNCCFEFFS